MVESVRFFEPDARTAKKSFLYGIKQFEVILKIIVARRDT